MVNKSKNMQILLSSYNVKAEHIIRVTLHDLVIIVFINNFVIHVCYTRIKSLLKDNC